MRRATDAVVLNADNRFSAAMLHELNDRKVWMVSGELGVAELGQRFSSADGFCLTGATDSGEWINLYHDDRVTPVMPVADIPATLDGRARFNVSNALQAIAASFLMGASCQQIRTGLTSCNCRFEDNPGRLNFYDGLPFTVLFDFAHNEHGHRALRKLVEGLPTTGARRIVLIPRGNTTEEQIFQLAQTVADGYDYFFCCEHPRASEREPGQTPEMLKCALVENGVAASKVRVNMRDDALNEALATCQQGDILVATTTTEHLYEDWARLEKFKNRMEASAEHDENS
jgi:cyanophycin synthetase